MFPSEAAKLTRGFTSLHMEKKDDGLRLGQRFYNQCIEGGPNARLFYEHDINECMFQIYMICMDGDQFLRAKVQKEIDDHNRGRLHNGSK